MSMTEIEVTVAGVVQGVSYRAYAQDSATALQLTGFVQNKPDGTVLVVAQGMPEILKEYIEYLHEGSLQAKVATLGVDWKTPKTVYDEFSILHD